MSDVVVCKTVALSKTDIGLANSMQLPVAKIIQDTVLHLLLDTSTTGTYTDARVYRILLYGAEETIRTGRQAHRRCHLTYQSRRARRLTMPSR